MVKKVLLAGDKFMPKMHLILVGFTYSDCGPSTKNKERIQILKEIGDSQYIHQKELNKACFQHDMAYADFKDLTRRIASKKYCALNHFMLLKTLNIMDIKEVFLQWFIKFVIKRLLVKELKIKIFLIKNQLKNYKKQLLQNLKH